MGTRINYVVLIVLLSQAKELPRLEQVRIDLATKGDGSARVESASKGPGASSAVEIVYEPQRMPVTARFGEDFVDTDYVDHEFWQVVESSNAKKRVLASPVVNGEITIYEGKSRQHFYRNALLEELAPDGKDTRNVRRFIYINALENVDSKALEAIVEVIRMQTDAL